MKTAFPLLTKNELANDFTEANLIGIFNDLTKTTGYIEITKNKTETTEIFTLLKLQNLTAVISNYYSFMSLRVFKENNINTLKAISNNIEENIDLLQSNSLLPFDVHESLFISECAKSCSSCASICEEKEY